MKKRSSFTLLEILIVVALIVLILTAMVVLLNPLQQINRGRDTQRKRHLDTLKKVFEDFYNDKGCYPKPVEVCYSGTDNGTPVNKNPCYICGSEATSPTTLNPYINPLPCDPTYPINKYSYQVDNLSCPTWFKIYVDFDAFGDPDSSNLGCGNGGCGISPNYGYDWGVASSNTTINVTTHFYCYTNSKTCDDCGSTYQTCVNRPTCEDIYGSKSQCCTHIPKPNDPGC